VLALPVVGAGGGGGGGGGGGALTVQRCVDAALVPRVVENAREHKAKCSGNLSESFTLASVPQFFVLDVTGTFMLDASGRGGAGYAVRPVCPRHRRSRHVPHRAPRARERGVQG